MADAASNSLVLVSVHGVQVTHIHTRTCHNFTRTCHNFTRTCHNFTRTCHNFTRTCHNFNRTCHNFNRTCHNLTRTSLRTCHNFTRNPTPSQPVTLYVGGSSGSAQIIWPMGLLSFYDAPSVSAFLNSSAAACASASGSREAEARPTFVVRAYIAEFLGRIWRVDLTLPTPAVHLPSLQAPITQVPRIDSLN